MNLNDGIHYDWEKTLSYDADVTMVVGAPNKGKTYGIRGYAICKRFLKTGRKFVEVCRQTTVRDDIKNNYMDKLLLNEPELAGYDFRCQKNEFFLKSPGGKWESCGYITSMPELQRTKQTVYTNVETIIEDEAIIESMDRWHRYQRNEWNILTRIVDSAVREQPEESSHFKPHVYLLGNAVDVTNPYFQVFGIKGVPEYGYHWYKNKRYLLHMVPPDEHDEKRLHETLAGRMGSVTGYTQQTYANEFVVNDAYIFPKPKRAKFVFGCKAYGEIYGIWADFTEGFYYVTGDIPNNSERVFSLTREDDTPNLIAARKTNTALKGVVDFYYQGAVLFESPRIRDGFLECMRAFGLS